MHPARSRPEEEADHVGLVARRGRPPPFHRVEAVPAVCEGVGCEGPHYIELAVMCSCGYAEVRYACPAALIGRVAASFRTVRLTPPGQQWLYREPIVLGATVHQADPKAA